MRLKTSDLKFFVNCFLDKKIGILLVVLPLKGYIDTCINNLYSITKGSINNQK